MNGTSDDGNSIDEVEKYNTSEHPDWLPNRRFLPGHCLRVRLFVEEVKTSLTSKHKKVSLGKSKMGYSLSDCKG